MIEDAKLEQIQKIIDMSFEKNDAEIAKEMKLPVAQVQNVRVFMGIRKRWRRDIRKEWKLINSINNYIEFGASLILRDFNLNTNKQHRFMAISIDKKNKTITLKIEEAD